MRLLANLATAAAINNPIHFPQDFRKKKQRNNSIFRFRPRCIFTRCSGSNDDQKNPLFEEDTTRQCTFPKPAFWPWASVNGCPKLDSSFNKTKPSPFVSYFDILHFHEIFQKMKMNQNYFT